MALILTPALYEVARMRAAGLPTAEIVRRTGKHRGTIQKQVSQVNKVVGRDRVALARALEDCVIVNKRTYLSRFGFQPGDTVKLVGGRMAGRVGTYLKMKNSTQCFVNVNGALLQPMAKHLELVRN